VDTKDARRFLKQRVTDLDVLFSGLANLMPASRRTASQTIVLQHLNDGLAELEAAITALKDVAL
jgi:uncharacterized coiled-coil protein SlyX